MCQSLFFNKVADLSPATLLKKRLWRRWFPVNFVRFLRTPFLKEHLWWLLLKLFGMVQNENLTEEIDLQEFHVKTLFWNYKRLSIQLRSSRPELLCEKGVLKSFVKFREKHLCRSLSFNEVAGLWSVTLL